MKGVMVMTKLESRAVAMGVVAAVMGWGVEEVREEGGVGPVVSAA